MSELKREDFYNTKWDVRDWTEEQKIQWQEKCFELGFAWIKSGHTFSHPYADFYYLERSIAITWGLGGAVGYTEKQFSDMFPEEAPLQPKLDVIQEIVVMVESHKSEISEEGDEDERGFEGLVYVEPKYSHSYIVLDKLSEEQKTFIQQNLDCDEDVSTTRYPKLSIHGSSWFTGFGFTNDTLLEVSFNHIFKYKEDL